MEENQVSDALESRIIPWIAAVSVLAGLFFLAAWIFRLYALLLIYPGAPVIHVNTCLNFIVAGLALWFGAKRRMGACLALGSVACVFCGLVLAEFLSHADWGMQRLFPMLTAKEGVLAAVKMGPYTALCFLLLGLMFVLLGLFPKKPWSHVTAAGLGGASVAIAALGLSGYLFGTESLQQWVYLVRMSFQSSVGLSLLGLGAMGLTFRTGFGLPNSGFWARCLPFAGMGSITATLILTQALVGQNHRLVEHLVEAKAMEIQRRFQFELGGYTGVLERIALRSYLYGSKPLPAGEKEWQEYRKRYPAFIGLAWSDTALRLHGSVPREGFSLDEGRRFGDGERLFIARPDGVAGTVSWIALANPGSKALAIAFPSRNPNGSGGYLVGLVGVKTLLESVLHSEAGSGYHWEIYLDGMLLYNSGPSSPQLRLYTRENDFISEGRSWRLTVFPGTQTLRDLSLPFPAWMLALGLFGGLVLTLSVFLAQLNHDRIRQLQRANMELSDQKNLLQQVMAARTEAEETSRKNRELLHTAVSNAPIIFSLLDKDYRYQLSMGKGLEARGQKEGELVGKSALELYGKIPGMAEMLREAMSGKQVQITAELGGRIVTAYDTPLFDAEGNVEAIVAISLDVTDQVKAETALRESEERFRALIQNSHDMVQLLSPEGVIVYESPSVTRVLGYAPEEMVGRNSLEFAHPEDSERMRELFGKGRPGGDGSPGVEIRIRHRDGSLRWIEAQGMNMTDHPAVAAFVVNFRDITDRKRAEAAMRGSEEHFRGLIQHSHDVIQLLSREGVLVYTSPSITPMLGYAPEEALGRTAPSFMHPQEVEQAEKIFGELQRNPGATVTAEVRLLHKDGSWHWMQVTATNLLQAPAIGAIVVNLRDVTDRVGAEKEIRRLKDNLEVKVAERTEQLASAVLELEAFSYSISHDLRAPLRHIGGFVTLLQAKSAERLDVQGRRYLGIIDESVKRMDGLISHLLAFSRMSRQELSKSRFSMGNLVKQCLAEMELELAGRRVTWDIAALPDAFGDPALIRQAVSNLLSNAVKFTKNCEEARIEIGSRRSGEETVYYIRDNGVGFDMKYSDKLFGVFQRLHSKSQFEGTGIGLANVRRIIERHGGKTWAEGMDGAGATFYFSLPDG